jgi:hypothetical protein
MSGAAAIEIDGLVKRFATDPPGMAPVLGEGDAFDGPDGAAAADAAAAPCGEVDREVTHLEAGARNTLIWDPAHALTGPLVGRSIMYFCTSETSSSGRTDMTATAVIGHYRPARRSIRGDKAVPEAMPHAIVAVPFRALGFYAVSVGRDTGDEWLGVASGV